MSDGHMIVSGAFGRIDVPKIERLECSYHQKDSRWVGSFVIDYYENIYLFDMASAGYKNNTLYLFDAGFKFNRISKFSNSAFKFKSVDFELSNGSSKQENFIRFFSPNRLTI